MIGFVLDVYIEYVVRVLARFIKRFGSTSWPVVEATVTSSDCADAALGCPVAEVS